jgi:hypothetical protein
MSQPFLPVIGCARSRPHLRDLSIDGMHPTPENGSAVTTGHCAMVSANSGRGADGDLLVPSPEPVAPSKRTDGIDVLRGLALSGVLMVNIVFEFRVSIFEHHRR